MMMFKKIIKLFFVLLALTLLTTHVYQNKHYFAYSFLAKEIDLENVAKAFKDDAENVFLLDASLKRVMKLGPDGTLGFEIHVDEYQEKENHLAKDIAVDDAGNLYVLNMVLDPSGVYLRGEEIVQYSPSGHFEQIVYQIRYTEDEKTTRPGRLQELRYYQGTLSFFDIQGQDLMLKSISLSEWKESTVYQIRFPEDPYIAQLLDVDNRWLFYTTKRAELFLYDLEKQESTLLFQNDGNDWKDAFPLYLDYQEPYLYFVDIGRKELIRLDPKTGSREVVASSEQWVRQGLTLSMTDAHSLYLANDNTIAMAVKDVVLILEPDGKIVRVYTSSKLTPSTVAFVWLLWGAVALAGILFLYLLRLIYVDWLKKRVPFMLKQILVFTPLLLSSMILVASFVYQNFSQKFEDDVFNKLQMMAHMASSALDVDTFLSIQGPADFKGEAYNSLDERNHFLLQGHPDLDSGSFYAALYRWQNEKLYVIMYFNTSVGTYYPMEYQEVYAPVLKEGRIVTLKTKESDGEWMFAVAPIYDRAGNIVGMQEVGMTLASFNEFKRNLFWTTGHIIAVLSPLILAFFLILTYFLLSSLRRLRKSVMEVACGNWDTEVTIKSRDEIEELGKQFNKMARYIRKYVEDLNESNESYFRFVPQQFIRFLDKDSILDIELGDQKMETMTIMIANIRSFFEISKDLSPQESFDFLNSYFRNVGPIVRNHGGFITRYLPSGIFALFAEKPLQAVLAAVEMQRTMHDMNQQRIKDGVQPMEFGVGIHCGTVMLGIIGEQKRMDSGVISDHVNLTTVLENHTELLGSFILVTNALADDLTRSGLSFRSLGLIKAEGRREPLHLYDVFEGDPEERRRNKLKTKADFEEAVRFYQEGRFVDARELFVKVLRTDRDDNVAKLYFYACDKYCEKGADTEFDGSLVLSAVVNE